MCRRIRINVLSCHGVGDIFRKTNYTSVYIGGHRGYIESYLFKSTGVIDFLSVILIFSAVKLYGHVGQILVGCVLALRIKDIVICLNLSFGKLAPRACHTFSDGISPLIFTRLIAVCFLAFFVIRGQIHPELVLNDRRVKRISRIGIAGFKGYKLLLGGICDVSPRGYGAEILVFRVLAVFIHYLLSAAV